MICFVPVQLKYLYIAQNLFTPTISVGNFIIKLQYYQYTQMALVVPPQFHYISNSLFNHIFYFDHCHFFGCDQLKFVSIIFLKMVKKNRSRAKWTPSQRTSWLNLPIKITIVVSRSLKNNGLGIHYVSNEKMLPSFFCLILFFFSKPCLNRCLSLSHAVALLVNKGLALFHAFKSLKEGTLTIIIIIFSETLRCPNDTFCLNPFYFRNSPIFTVKFAQNLNDDNHTIKTRNPEGLDNRRPSGTTKKTPATKVLPVDVLSPIKIRLFIVRQKSADLSPLPLVNQ